MNSTNVNLSESLHEIRQLPVIQEKVGSRICDKMNTLLAGAIALQKIAEVTCDHGNRMISTGITLATGIGCLAHGNFIFGGIATFSGLKEAVNIWREVNPTGNMANLLNDANAGVDMIKTLEEANSASFKIVDSNLTIIRNNVKKMNDRMQKIKDLSSDGQKDIEEYKVKAKGLYKEAQDQFSTAKATFKLSQAKLNQASTFFFRSLKQFDELSQLAQITDLSDKAKIEKFILIADKIQKQCLSAQAMLQEGNEQMQEGITALDLAQQKEREAYGQSILVMERAKNRLELMGAQAKVKREYEKKVDDTKNELNDVQERNKEIKGLLNELSDDLKAAKKQSDNKFGTTTILLGVIPGAAIGSAVGWTGAFAGGCGGGTIVHNRKAIINKVDDFINGPVSFLDTRPNQSELVKVKFSSRSTGWYNRWIKKANQSYTVGVVDIKVGKDVVTLPFNLNKDYKISKSDLYDLQQLLGRKVISGEMKAQECLNVISELETKFLDRGSDQRSQIGLISGGCLYFNELKRACMRIVKTESKTVEDIVEGIS